MLLLCDYDGEDNGVERRYHLRDDGDGAHSSSSVVGCVAAGSGSGGAAKVVVVVVVLLMLLQLLLSLMFGDGGWSIVSMIYSSSGSLFGPGGLVDHL